MTKSIIIISLMLIILTLAGGIWLTTANQSQTFANLDDFAKCLTKEGVVMYGATWCSHCQNEKRNFGQSFQFIKYIECPDNPQICLNLGINSYPTWVTGSGAKLTGEQGPAKLAKVTNCPLPYTQ